MAKKENTYDFLSNSLILVKSPYSKSNINSVEELKNSDIYLVIGNPDTAPVGNYTLTALKNLEILDKLNREKLVYAKDVSAVVQYVEMGEADFGVIYNSDRNRMKNPIVVEEFPENLYDKVIYSVAILNNSDDVKKLFEFLRENKEVFKKYGFVVM